MLGLTQMSKALDGVGGRRSHDPACYQTTSAILIVDPSQAMGSATVVTLLVSLSCFHFVSTTHDCYDCKSLPIHPRWALVCPRTSSRGQVARCLHMMQYCGLNQKVNRVASLGSRPIGMCSQVLVYRPMLSRVWSMR